MPKNYNYGFEFAENGDRKIIRYRQDKLWFAPGLAWWVFFQLIALFFFLGQEGLALLLPFVALGVLAWWRSRKRQILVGQNDVIVNGKTYDRAKITQVFVESNNVRQTFSPQDYNQLAREAERNPLGGDPALIKAGAMAGDLSKGIAMMVAGGIDSTGKRAHMTYDGKKVVIAKWLSVQRALLLSNALASHLGFAVDAEHA